MRTKFSHQNSQDFAVVRYVGRKLYFSAFFRLCMFAFLILRMSEDSPALEARAGEVSVQKFIGWLRRAARHGARLFSSQSWQCFGFLLDGNPKKLPRELDRKASRGPAAGPADVAAEVAARRCWTSRSGSSPGRRASLGARRQKKGRCGKANKKYTRLLIKLIF